MASASSAACQATSMTHKLRQKWAKKHYLDAQERARALSLDSTQIPQGIPMAPGLKKEALGSSAKIQLKIDTTAMVEPQKSNVGLTHTLMEKFSNLTRIRHGSGDLERMRNPSEESTTSENSENSEVVPGSGRMRHFSESSKLTGDFTMDNSLASNSSNS